MRTSALILCTLIGLGVALPSISAPAATDAERAAAAIATAGKGFSPVVNPDGSLKRNAAGELQMKPGSALDPRTGQAYFEALTGVKGAELSGIASPSGVGNSRLNQTLSTDVSCALDAGRERSVAGVSFKFDQCLKGASGKITGLQLRYCDARLNGEYCSVDRYSDIVTVPADQYGQFEFGQAGLGCVDAQGFCRMTVSVQQTLSGNVAQLRSRTEALAAGQTEANSFRGAVSRTVTNPEYAEKMIAYGSSLKECVDKNVASLGRDEAVSTCNGYWNAQVSAGGKTCEVRQYCAKPVTTQLTYQRSCTRTFGLTGAKCESSIPTLTCEVTLDKNQQQIASTCMPEQLEGAEIVGQSKLECSKSGTPAVGGSLQGPAPVTEEASESPSGSAGCEEFKRTDYYSFPSKATNSECTFSPRPAATSGLASCDMSSSETELACQADGWFGRTLSAEECSTVPEGLDLQGVIELSYTSKPGCGVCVKPVRTYTCYAQPAADQPEDSCSAAELEGCQYVSTSVQSTTTGGLVTSQEEVYSCVKADQGCEQWATEKVDPSCVGDLMGAQPTPETVARPDNSKAMGEALAAAAIMNAVTQAESGDPTIPRIFNGESQTCKKPTGGFGSLLYQDCCKISLERPKTKFGKFNECTMDEAELAASRRAHYSKYIGDRCSKRTAFPRKCIQRTQHYCSFDGILPRLVHEQGRAQLAQIVRSSSAAQREVAPVAFNYYRPDNLPGWTEVRKVNGVSVAFFQQPAYCADLKKADQALRDDPDAYECPGKLVQWVATCESSRCAELPVIPEHGAENWTMTALDPLENITTAIGKGSVASGACSTSSGTCDYEIVSWPAGQQGKAVVSKDVSFPIYQAEASTAAGALLTNAGDLVINPQPASGSTSQGLPAQVQIRLSHNGGTSWSGYSLPSRINGEVTLPGTEVRVAGGCDIGSNLCQYRFTTSVAISAKPWGQPGGEDCSGFTAGQLSVLDFGKMDLSEWLATVMDKVRGSTSSNIAQIAASQFSAYNDVMTGNTSAQAKAYQSPDSARPAQSAADPSGATFASVTPSEGFGPFVAQIRTSAVWPFATDDPERNKDRVLSVSVDWGDCSPIERLVPASTVFGPQAQGFIGSHPYPAPDELGCRAARANVLIPVVLTIETSLSGTQKVSLQVQNAWSTMPGAASSGLEQNKAVTGGSRSR